MYSCLVTTDETGFTNKLESRCLGKTKLQRLSIGRIVKTWTFPNKIFQKSSDIQHRIVVVLLRVKTKGTSLLLKNVLAFRGRGPINPGYSVFGGSRVHGTYDVSGTRRVRLLLRLPLGPTPRCPYRTASGLTYVGEEWYRDPSTLVSPDSPDPSLLKSGPTCLCTFRKKFTR